MRYRLIHRAEPIFFRKNCYYYFFPYFFFLFLSAHTLATEDSNSFRRRPRTEKKKYISFHSILFCIGNSCRRISHTRRRWKKTSIIIWLQRVEICNSVSNNFRGWPQSDTQLYNSSQRLWLKFNWFFSLFLIFNFFITILLFLFPRRRLFHKMSKRFVRFIGQ